MDNLVIASRLRNPYRVPVAKGEILAPHHTIPAGGTGRISTEAHQAAMKANKAYRALVGQRKLVIKSPLEGMEEVHPEDLRGTSEPSKPADLTEPPAAKGAERDIEATVESKEVEWVDAPATENAPAKQAPAKNKK